MFRQVAGCGADDAEPRRPAGQVQGDSDPGRRHRYVARRLGPQPAADVVSEVFLVAFRNRTRYRTDRADARPWLYGIATRMTPPAGLDARAARIGRGTAGSRLALLPRRQPPRPGF